MSDKNSKHNHRDRDNYHGSEVKSHHSTSSSSSSYGSHHKRSEAKCDDYSRRRKHRRSRSRSRDKNRSERERRHHKEKSASRSPHRRSDDGRNQEHRREGSRRKQRSRSHSRSSSRERERAREKNKQEMKLQMQRNYEQQIEKMKNSTANKNSLVPEQAANQASKLVEQIQQRKLLFGKKTEEPPKATTLWKQPAFAGDSDGKMSAKFKRLMGMKDGGGESTSETASGSESDAVKKQQKCLADLEKQYEVARVTTHTQRGLGLGFGSGNSLHP